MPDDNLADSSAPNDIPPDTSAPGWSSCPTSLALDATPRISFEKLLRLIVLSAGAWLCIEGLSASAFVLAPAVAAVFMALVISSPFGYLCRVMPRSFAALLISFAWTGGLMAVVLTFPLWSDSLVVLYDVCEHHLVWLREMMALIEEKGPEYGVDFTGTFANGQWIYDASSWMAQLLIGLVSTLVLLGFTLGEMWGLREKFEAALGHDPRRMVLVADITARVRTYFHLKSLSSITTGVVVGAGCAVVGVDLWFLWGILALVLNYIPTVGSIIAAIPPVLLAGATLGWELALVVAGIYLVTNIVVGAYLEPKLMGDRMGLSPLVVLLSLAFWGWVWGPIGMLLAVPLTVVLKIIMAQTRELRPFAILLSSPNDLKRYRRRRSRTLRLDPSIADRCSEDTWPE